MTFFSDLLPTIPINEDGWDYATCDGIWLIASVDTFEEVPTGRPVFLCRDEKGCYYWSFELEDATFAFQALADAKAELAAADRHTSLRLYVLSVGDLLRYEHSERRDARDFVPSPMSAPFFIYKHDPQRWSNKRGRGSG